MSAPASDAKDSRMGLTVAVTGPTTKAIYTAGFALLPLWFR
jgi:hypothetical protein